MAILSMAYNIALAAFGLGFVIFIHELGHFMLAKFNGVKVEKFSIGFGPSLLHFQLGETVYSLSILPLGGFVKMLGEGTEDEASSSSDPRSYQNKSVGRRMSIISAGVIMNLIFGLICFVIYYSFETKETPARIGGVLAGSPAFEAGLAPGDEIVAIDGKGGIDYRGLRQRVGLSGEGQVVKLTVKRPGKSEPIELRVVPERKEGMPTPTIGILPDFDSKLDSEPYAPPAGAEGRLQGDPSGPIKDDKLVEAGPSGGTLVPIHNVEEWNELISKNMDKPIDVVLERTPKKKEGASADEAENVAPTPRTIKLTLPPARFVDLGARLKFKPIASTTRGGPAAVAGLIKGDRIVKIDGKDDFDPMRLPTYCYEHAGKPIAIEVERSGIDPNDKSKEKVERKTFTVTPDASLPWVEPVMGGDEPLKVAGLGLAYGVDTEIAAVRPDSPAAKAGLKAGDVIEALAVVAYGLGSLPAQEQTFEFRSDDKKKIPVDWSGAFRSMQMLPRHSVQVKIKGIDYPIFIMPEPDPTWPYPLRGLMFQAEVRTAPPQGVAAALESGFEDTVDSILMIYATFRGLIQSRLSPKTLGGPIKIASIGYQAASLGILELLHFLGLLSVNLAVLNFLPISPLDGGHFLFLLIEKIIGRPVPEAAQAAVQWLGIGLVLALFVLVTIQDIKSFF